MNTPPTPKSGILKRQPREKGAALLTTLVVVSLLTIIVISFFAMVGTAKRSSSLHSDVASLQNLKDSAVSLALAQIREGTTREDEIWTSQPGAIRTFGEATGAPARIYKLYSDDEMTVDASGLTSPSALNLTDDVPADWKAVDGVFVDLNEPVASMSDQDLHFPIVDPRIFDGKTGTASTTPEGFSYSQNHAAGGGSVTGVLGPNDASHPNDQRIPMPVKWVYQLRDGSLGTLDDSGTFKPFSGETTATAENPMVGRFAFWTDDESGKINLNTASEAVPWDTPKAATPEDVEFAKYTPVKNEVQRFGGHPAATSLSSVFFPNRELDPVADRDIYEAIYDLVPRVSLGGYVDGKSRNPVAFDTDRLYANVDEALLQPARMENSLFQYAGAKKLGQSRFLLTANSRAPEVTAAGTPRVCLWPVSQNESGNHRTAFDELIAFNSTLNSRPYFYRRAGGTTNIQEYRGNTESNAHILEYIYSLANEKKQGYPLSMEDKYGEQNTASGAIAFTEYIRQTNLYDNTRGPSGAPVIPYTLGIDNTVWGTEFLGQVTNISNGNLPPFIREKLKSNVKTNGIGRIYTSSEVGLVFCLAAEHKSDGSKFNDSLVDTLEIPKGYKAIQVMPVVEGFNPAQGYAMTAPASSVQLQQTTSLRIGASGGEMRKMGGKVTQTSPNLQQASVPELWGKRYGGDSGIIHSVSYLRNLAAGDAASDKNYSPANWWVGWGGSGGRWMYVGTNANNNASHMQPRVPANGDLDDPSRKIPTQYSRGFFLIPSDADKMEVDFSGSKTFGWRQGNQRDGDFQGTMRALLPDDNKLVVPVPEEPVNLSETIGQRYIDTRKDGVVNPEVIDPSDVVRTWVSRHGDHRLRYVREDDSASLPDSQMMFIPHPDWDPEKAGPDALTTKQIHSFTLPGGTPEAGATFKRGLVRGVNYPADITPDFTIDPDSDNAFEANRPSSYPYALDPTDTRDWDNGTGIAPDGAYWNKVDDIAYRPNGNFPPYFSKQLWDGTTKDQIDETSAPNEQVPSAAIFGSINSAAATGIQWTTYLFRPELLSGGHLGAANRTITGDRDGAPADHTILDWFWMPVIQPYAISERFSTAGKINMNYRIAPFSYINRATGLHATLKSERLLAIPTNAGLTYKDYASVPLNTGWRHRIDAEETLQQFEQKFDDGDVFRLASEICEQFLVPKGESLTGIKAFWNKHLLTGDNTLERPYANLYPRLTTRSNVYRVHLIAQTLRKSRESDPAKFDSTLDSFVGEYRGEALMERAIDPNDPEIPNYVQDYNFAEPKLDNFYNYRILYNRRFAP